MLKLVYDVLQQHFYKKVMKGNGIFFDLPKLTKNNRLTWFCLNLTFYALRINIYIHILFVRIYYYFVSVYYYKIRRMPTKSYIRIHT